MSTSLEHEKAVLNRYSVAANNREETLCCPVEYRTDLLEAIPQEILERDYGCGDPSPFVAAGDTVLDLGSGGGKLCFIASQLVGPNGSVIGVDCNVEMLGLARKYQPQVIEKIGYDNISFRCGMIQNLQLDLEQLAREMDGDTSSSVQRILKQRQVEKRLCHERPMIASQSIDCVVSNCVLNLVQPQDRRELFSEVFRVLKNGGRAVISDIVADEDVPEYMKDNPMLWSGCISGAWREDQFLQEFESAGFHGVMIAKRVSKPWQTVEGIDFRSVTVLAYKGKQGPCLERNQALIYRGPFKEITDDDGHTFHRGVPTAVCDKTFNLLQKDPYGDAFIAVSPHDEVPIEKAEPFDCTVSDRRDPRKIKAKANDDLTQLPVINCSDGECC
jgi:arsenite methyltransferase